MTLEHSQVHCLLTSVLVFQTGLRSIEASHAMCISWFHDSKHMLAICVFTASFTASLMLSPYSHAGIC